ncbi:MAG: alpha/beta fold hydrolase [Parvularculaceae bacterium]|nr:alpha/beta fold hydrolase [Parvularculaceae bacterium]
MGDIVYEMYGAAMNPERYQGLVDAWEALLPQSGELSKLNLDAAAAARHVEQALRILEGDAPFPDLEGLFAVYDHLPAFLFGADGALVRMNASASNAFVSTQKVRTAGDVQAVMGEASSLLSRSIPIRVEDGVEYRFIIYYDTGAVSSTAGRIAEAFELTHAEREVLALTLQGLSRKELAQKRKVSPETVKKQVERIFSKTGTQSQLELTLMSSSMYRDAEERGGHPTALSCAAVYTPYFADERHFEHEGRTITYRVFGAEAGRPVLAFHGTYGFCQWPEEAEAACLKRGYRVIVPIRPGYGNTSHAAGRGQALASIFADMDLILDREAVDQLHLLSMENDSFLAFKYAAQRPDRIQMILAFAGMLPMSQDEQYQRMDKWHRFVQGTARYTPALIPLVVKAGFRFAAKVGRQEFVKQVYGSSAPDLAVIDDPKLFEAIMAGTRVALSPKHLAHKAFAAELVAFAGAEWVEDVRACEGVFPVHFINGATDPIAPPATLATFEEDFPWIQFECHEDAGQFVFFTHWHRFFELLDG